MYILHFLTYRNRTNHHYFHLFNYWLFGNVCIFTRLLANNYRIFALLEICMIISTNMENSISPMIVWHCLNTLIQLTYVFCPFFVGFFTRFRKVIKWFLKFLILKTIYFKCDIYQEHVTFVIWTVIISKVLAIRFRVQRCIQEYTNIVLYHYAHSFHLNQSTLSQYFRCKSVKSIKDDLC